MLRKDGDVLTDEPDGTVTVLDTDWEVFQWQTRGGGGGRVRCKWKISFKN